MAALQMMDLLKRGEDFHQRLAGYYQGLSRKAGREKTRELLDYLSQHEMHLGHCLEDYERQAPRTVTGHWFQWVPDMDTARRMEEATLSEDASAAEVIELARRLDGCQIQFYQELVETCPPGELREVLGGLLEMERQQERLLVRNLEAW